MKSTTIAIDLSKSVFEVAVSEHPGQVGQCRTLSRNAHHPSWPGGHEPPRTGRRYDCSQNPRHPDREESR